MLARLIELFSSGTNTYDASPPRGDEAKRLAAELSKLGPITAGGVLRTSTRLTLSLLLLRASVCPYVEKTASPAPLTLKVSHAPISVGDLECLF